MTNLDESYAQRLEASQQKPKFIIGEKVTSKKQVARWVQREVPDSKLIWEVSSIHHEIEGIFYTVSGANLHEETLIPLAKVKEFALGLLVDKIKTVAALSWLP